MFAIKPIKYNDTDDYSYMTLLGVEGVYTPSPIQPSSVPEGFHHYTLSSGKGVLFAFVHARHLSKQAGSFLSKQPLDLEGKDKRSLSKGDWCIHDKQSVDFEAFWGHKLSIDKQISNAAYKRDLAMGSSPGGRDTLLTESMAQESILL